MSNRWIVAIGAVVILIVGGAIGWAIGANTGGDHGMNHGSMAMDQKEFLAMMVAHHQGAVDMAKAEIEAGGFQPMEAYDVLVANLDPTGSRRAVPDDRPEEVLAEFPLGLTTQEVAEVMRTDIEQPLDRRAAAQMLIRAVGRGAVAVEPLGDDGLWSAI